MILIDQTNQFKTILITLKFTEHANPNTFAIRSLIPSVLKTKTNLYKNRIAFNQKLENLYGASLSTGMSKLGTLSVINIQFRIIDPKLALEPDFFKDSVAFLHEYVYGHKSFVEKELELEKKLFIDEVKSKENDKTKYALSRLFEEMCPNELYGFKATGSVSDIEAITMESFKKAYKQMITKNTLQVVVSGDLTLEHKKLIETVFDKATFEPIDFIDRETKKVTEVKEITQTDKISQTKLNIGYRLPIRQKDALQYPATLMNAALGGYVHSRLFLNVREKHSLCYYIASIYDSYKGILFIYSGVDAKRLDLAKKVIDEEINKISNVLLTDAELSLSKQAIINDLKESEDSQSARQNLVYMQNLLDQKVSLQERIDKILAVTPEQVLEAAKLLVKDTVFQLDVER